jgi:hypothetical protein
MTAQDIKPALIETASGRASARACAIAYFFYFSNEGVGAVA